jgi:hypothetical protein
LITFLVKISKTRYLCPLLAIVAASLCAAGAYHAVVIRTSYQELLTRRGDVQETVSLEPVFSLSKTEKNVIVMMADGAINGFVPLIFEDHPELYGQFDGFTLYPNTVSFAAHTLMGVPPVWGGYDYTPFEMNRRNETPLAEKHNEALLTLPLLFSQAGFNVTVTDPSWANYAWISDLSIYENLDNTQAFNTIGRYTGLWYDRNGLEKFDFTGQKIMRNVIWFSFLKITVPVLRSIVYDKGLYWGTDNMGSSIVEFIKSYAVLDFLPELTGFNSEKSSALLLTNEATHEFIFLQPPAYTPGSEPSKIGNSPYAENSAYHANSALYLKLGQWFDVLKENGVYDNTRIIITADHGGGVGGMISGEPLRIKGESRERYNPVLLVKDFGDHGTFAVDAAFMTNADVPALAVRGLLDHPVNPFTGNPLADILKKDEALITTGHIPMADGHGKYVFTIKKNQWMRVHDNIFDSANWEAVEK